LLSNEVIPQIHAEAEDGAGSLHEAIADHQRDQTSTGAEGTHGSRPTAAEQPSGEQSFLDAVKSTKPLLDGSDREAFDSLEMHQNELREEDAEEEEVVEEEDDNDLGENPKIATMLSSQLAEQREREAHDATQQQPESEHAQYQSYIGELQRIAADPALNDPTLTKAVVDSLCPAFGADTPESRANVENMVSVLTMGGINLINTLAPLVMEKMFSQVLENHLPGLRESHFDGIAKNAWAEVMKDPNFRDLPADINSPEFEELRAKVLAEAPWMETIVFRDEQGRQLHPSHPKAVRMQAAVFAKLASGQKVTPETIAKAVARGKREAQGHERRVTASRALHSGRSSRGAGSFGSNAKDTSFLDSIREYNRSKLSSENYED
jgi:hypothetical protein